MPRPRSEKVIAVKQTLAARLADPHRPPGTRFLSARAVASQYGVSYQTAHRLLAELAGEGKLLRRPASGSFRPGKAVELVGVQLIFHERARRPGSFGAKLLQAIQDRLSRDRVDVRSSWYRGEPPRLLRHRVAVLWEAPAALRRCVEAKTPTLLLNDRPPPGLDSLHVDSVGVDDFAGGALAGQILRERVGSRVAGRFVIVAGPVNDRRSTARVEGCRSTLRGEIRVVHADGWYHQHGVAVSADVLRGRPAGIFCCNDRLAEGFLSTTQTAPPVVGFDDAPIAEALSLTTIAIPWHDVAAAAGGFVRRRLGGDAGSASHQVVMPRPMLRWEAKNAGSAQKQ